MFKLITLTSRLSVCCPDRVVVAFPVGKIIHLFLDCLKHNRSLCHECKEDGLCDGQAADECEFMKLAAFETTFNDRLTKLNDQFASIHGVLKTKKEAFIEMYRKDPRFSHDDAVSVLQRINEDFDPSYPERERDAMQQQLAELQEQLAGQENIVAEAEAMRRNLAQIQREKINLQTRLEGTVSAKWLLPLEAVHIIKSSESPRY